MTVQEEQDRKAEGRALAAVEGIAESLAQIAEGLRSIAGSLEALDDAAERLLRDVREGGA